MPQRDGGGQQGQQRSATNRNRVATNNSQQQNHSRQAPTRNNQRGGAGGHQQQNSQTDENGDAWDDIMNMKGAGGDGSFDKMNTNFFLKDGEEIDIVVLDENPFIFWGHTVKCQTDKGTTFYRTERCQKCAQDYCVLCESDNTAVGKSKKVIAFRVLDSRGSWDKKLNGGNGGMDGEPVPKIFLPPLYLAKQFKALKDDGDGTISDKVIKLSKNTNYVASFKFKKGQGGALHYVDAPIFDGDLPEVLEDVYAPMSDDDLYDFLDRFASAPAPQRQQNNQRGNGGGNATGQRGGGSAGRAGSFGD